MTDVVAAARIAAFLEALKGDPDFLSVLLAHSPQGMRAYDFTGNVKRWIEGSRHVPGDLWRFRIFGESSTNYRTFYGYHWQTKQCCVLAVAHKDLIDYDRIDNALSDRVLGDWRALVE